jgi:hypothetical protein
LQANSPEKLNFLYGKEGGFYKAEEKEGREKPILA